MHGTPVETCSASTTNLNPPSRNCSRNSGSRSFSGHKYFFLEATSESHPDQITPYFEATFKRGEHKSWIDIMVTVEFMFTMNISKFATLQEITLENWRGIHTQKTASHKMDQTLLLDLEENNLMQKFINLKMTVKTSLRHAKYECKRRAIGLHLEWESRVKLSTVKHYALVSLRGIDQNITIQLIKTEPANNFTLGVYWIHDIYEKYTTVFHMVDGIYESPDEDYESLILYTVLEELKFVYFRHVYEFRRASFLNWVFSSKLCQSFDGFLPVIRSREEQEELVAFLKLAEGLLPIEFLYIGLTDQKARKVRKPRFFRFSH